MVRKAEVVSRVKKDCASDNAESAQAPAISSKSLHLFTTPQPEEDARDIREYVENEADEKVEHLEKIKTEVVLGARYDVWDVHTDKNRWWVINHLVNLYDQKQFPSLDYVLSFHIGLMARLSSKDVREPDESAAKVLRVFRKLDQANAAFEIADEVEEFQAIGLHLRETLLALIPAIQDHVIIPAGDAPKASDFKRWAELGADALATGARNADVRSSMKHFARATWDLVNWLTHAQNAVIQDVIVAMAAANSTIDIYAMVIKKKEAGSPDRCPNCGSYKIHERYRPELVEYGASDSQYLNMCGRCDWTDPFGSYFDPTDLDSNGE